MTPNKQLVQFEMDDGNPVYVETDAAKTLTANLPPLPED